MRYPESAEIEYKEFKTQVVRTNEAKACEAVARVLIEHGYDSGPVVDVTRDILRAIGLKVSG